jgi:hypothetical protein
MLRPEGDPVRHVPWAAPGRKIDAAWCLSVLDGVAARSFAAGFALELAQQGGAGPAAGLDHALGQLDQIVRGVRDIAFYLAGADTRILPIGPASASEGGTG